MAGADIGDLYELLGVSPEASDDEIKKAYRARARELHPDTGHGSPEAEARFKEVTVAYEVLRDPDRRARYDRYGAEGVFGSSAGGGMAVSASRAGWATSSRPSSDPWPAPGHVGAVPSRGPTPRCGSPRVLRGGLRLPQGDLGAPARDVRGVHRHGDGAGHHRDHLCGLPGHGRAAPGAPVTPRTGRDQRRLPALLGFGEMTPHPCPMPGRGTAHRGHNVPVEVPAGVEDGSTLRLAERGAAGQRGGPSGSLFVHLAVTPDHASSAGPTTCTPC